MSPADTEVWYIRGEGGAILEMVPPFGEGIDARLRAGALVRVNPDGTRWDGAATPAVAAAGGPSTLAEKQATEELTRAVEDTLLRDAPSKPARTGKKADWVEYVVFHHADEITRSAAEELTRDELVARFGDREPTADEGGAG